MIALAALLAFHNSFSTPFHLDDEINIVDNASIRALWPLGPVLFPPTDVFSAGRPLLNLSFAVNHAIGGQSVTGYHIVNFAVHVLAGLVLHGILRRTFARPAVRGAVGAAGPGLALAAAVLWVVHPLHTNSVTYISQRAESLMGLFYLLTLYSFIRSTEAAGRVWPAVAMASCFAGVATKEVMVTAPLLVFLYDRTFVAGTFRQAWRQHGRLHLGLAASWLLLAFLLASTRIADRGIGTGFHYSPWSYLLVECEALVRYLKLCFWPFPLVFDYGPDLAVAGMGDLAPRALLLLVLLAATIAALRRMPAIGFVGCWFFLILLPTSSIVPVAGQPIAENRVYLASIAAMVALAIALNRLAGRRAFGMLVVLGAALTTLTSCRNRDFESELRLWADTLRKTSGNSRAFHLHAKALLNAGRVDEAIRELETSVRLRPLHFTFARLGVALFQQGRSAEALPRLEAAVRLKPDYVSHRVNLGGVYFALGRPQDAVAQYQEALRLNPRHVPAHANLAIVLGRLGRFAEAIAEFEEVLRLDPNHPAAPQEIAQLKALDARSLPPVP